MYHVTTRALSKVVVSVDACPHSRTSVGFPNDFALKWANHISSIVKGDFWMPDHAFHMYFSFNGHCAGTGDETRQSQRRVPDILLCLRTVRNTRKVGALEPVVTDDIDAMASHFGQEQPKTKNQKQ